MKPHTCPRSARLALACAAVAAALSLAPAPALALSSGSSEAGSLLPTIDASVPDDATLISSEYALLSDGEVVRTSDGSVVEDTTEILGTEDAPPDPLAMTGGERFEPVTVGEARSAGSSAQLLSIAGAYDAYWGTYQGSPAYYMADGSMFACQAIAVVDVSEHNGTIDWAAAKADGVEGAIIRIGFGTSRMDYCVSYNVSECERLGIPYGIYLYSYAEDADDARSEGRNLVSWLRQLGIEPGDLDLPVYYDLEAWSWTGHQPPTSPAVYEGIVRAFMEEVEGAGYTASVYSYRSYLYGALNSSYIHQNTSWAAEYGPSLLFTDFGSNFRGWQYTSSGSVAGFAGNVDLNAFGNGTWVEEGSGSGGDADADETPQPEEGCPSAGYSDVVPGEWYHEAVDWAISTGLMTGYGDQEGVFGTSDALSRAQMAQILWNFAGNPEADLSVLDGYSDVTYSDDSGDQAYIEAIAWCTEQGYMSGYEDGRFGIADYMTREQLVTVLWRAAGSPETGYDISAYKDAGSVSEFARSAMSWAVSVGAITGQGSTRLLDPQGALERCQAAVVFMRLYA